MRFVLTLPIKAYQKYDESLIESGVKNSKDWFNDEMTAQECKEMYKTKLSHKDKYSSIKSSEYIIDKAKSWFNSGRWSSPRIKNEISYL